MVTRTFEYDGRTYTDPRNSRAWRRLRDQVVAEEPECQLALPGCTRLSTTADHIQEVSKRPDLAMDRNNHRGSCGPCNELRNRQGDPLEAVRAAAARPRALDIFKPL